MAEESLPSCESVLRMNSMVSILLWNCHMFAVDTVQKMCRKLYRQNANKIDTRNHDKTTRRNKLSAPS